MALTQARRLAVAGATTLVAALALAGCGSSSSTASAGGGTVDISAFQTKVDALYKGTSQAPDLKPVTPKSGVKAWFISCGMSSEGCSTPAKGAQAAATALGWQLKVFDGNFGQGDAYNTGIRQAIADHADVIITNGVNCSAAKSGYTEAKAAGIPVIGAPGADCDDPLENSGKALMTGLLKYNSAATDTASFNEALGAAKADWVIVHSKGRARTILLDFKGLVSGQYITKGFQDEFAKCTGCKIVDTVSFTPADLAGNLKANFASAFTAHPEADTVVAPFDSIITGSGVAQTVASSGRGAAVGVVGGEAFSPNVELISTKRGQTAATPYDETWVGWAAVDEAVRVLAGGDTVAEGIGIQLVDADHNLPASGGGYTTSIDYKSAYLKSWGK
jgi:ribose transport system substrate-binding protein